MITKDIRKALDIKPSGRSSDYITPSFGFGCLFNCAYCYVRRHKPAGVSIAKNTEAILTAIIKHHSKLGPKISNQTHNSKWTYDLSCNEDFALHWKYHDSELILDTLIDNDIFPTFATKYVNNEILKYNPEEQARIRFSLMPQEFSTILEPGTSSIEKRISAINSFKNAGWDVHINFSPVIVNEDSYRLYKDLFEQINDVVLDTNKLSVKAEVIFLTHNNRLHEFNMAHNPEAEKLLWQPDMQEHKISSFGTHNLRYKWQDKIDYVERFKKLHSEIIPWNTIRYIF